MLSYPKYFYYNKLYKINILAKIQTNKDNIFDIIKALSKNDFANIFNSKLVNCNFSFDHINQDALKLAYVNVKRFANKRLIQLHKCKYNIINLKASCKA